MKSCDSEEESDISNDPPEGIYQFKDEIPNSKVEGDINWNQVFYEDNAEDIKNLDEKVRPD